MAVSVSFPVLLLCWLASGADPTVNLDVVAGKKIYGFIDDAWRFYLSRSAFINPELYNWNYVLPVGLFVDGLVTRLAGGDVFLSRAILSLQAVGTVYFVSAICRLLGAGRLPSVFAGLAIGLMPLFVFVSTSFYGEPLLALLLSAAWYSWLRNGHRVASILYSLAPLVRPDGVFYMLPYGINLLRRRDYAGVTLLVAPGTMYFLYLVFSLPDPSLFFSWRVEARELAAYYTSRGNLELVPAWQFLSTFNLVFVLAALAGFTSRELRKYWPFWGGGVLWLVWLLSLIANNLAAYEARYFVSALPFMGVGFGAFLHRAQAWLRQSPGKWLRVRAAFPAVVAVLVVSEHFLQIDALQYRFGGDTRWPVAGRGAVTDGFRVEFDSERVKRAAVARVVHHLVMKRDDIDSVYVNDHAMFFALDPAVLEPRVQVKYLGTLPRTALRYHGGRFLAMYPYAEQHSTIKLMPGPAGADGAALLVGNLDDFGWPPFFRRGRYAVYGVGYQRVDGWEGGHEVFSGE